MTSIKEDYQWFKDNRDQIIANHIGERVVIKDKNIVGYFPDDKQSLDAMNEKGFPMGTYIVQRCLSEDSDTEYYYTGRYAFV